MSSSVDFDNAEDFGFTVEDGRNVSWQEAPEFYQETTSRIVALLALQDPDSVVFNQMVAQFARLGATDAESLSLLEKDIAELKILPDGMIVQVGFGKWLSKCWHKHKKEIIIGIIVAAVVVTAVVVATCAAGAAAGTAAGGVAAGLSNDKDPDSKKSTPTLNKNTIPNTSSQPLSIPQETLSPIPPISPPAIPNFWDKDYRSPEPSFSSPREELSSVLREPPVINPSFAFAEKGVQIGQQVVPYQEFMQQVQREGIMPRPAEPSRMTKVLTGQELWKGPSPEGQPSGLTRALLDRELWDPEQDMIPPPSFSRCFITEGERPTQYRIGGINGMDTLIDQAHHRADYIQQFIPKQSIEWVYNQTHTPIVDAAEAFFLNFNGYSPNTARLLQENWTAFHEENKDHPRAKYLQFGHSQGVLAIKNALNACPQEIRDRVIVVAIAPAAVVPRGLCFQAFNYASEKDVVHLAELLHASLGNLGGESQYETLELAKRVNEDRKDLIILPAHPDATGIDHDFESPTFFDSIKKRVEDYLNHNGEYE